MRSRSSVGNGRRWLVVGAAGVGGLVLLCLATLVIHRRAVDIPRVPVLVELFTSQGCASCPPADELLITLDQEQFVPGALVIPLSEHVAYWNGRWRDPFSSSVFTERQRRYHDIRGSRMLFTPEMVVDGRRQFVGSQRMLAEHAIAHTAMMPKASITMAVGPSTTAERVHVNVEVSGISRVTPRSDIDLWIAITEDGFETDVELGENARRRPSTRGGRAAPLVDRDTSNSGSRPLRRVGRPLDRSGVATLKLAVGGIYPGAAESSCLGCGPGASWVTRFK